MAVRKLEAAVLRRLAVRASCSPETIQKVYQGQPVRGLAFYRATAALHESGIEPLKPAAPVLSVVRSADEGKHEASPDASGSEP